MTSTAAKRRAALGLGRPGAVLPNPDGTIDAADRAALVGAYALGAEGENSKVIRITPIAMRSIHVGPASMRGITFD